MKEPSLKMFLQLKLVDLPSVEVIHGLVDTKTLHVQVIEEGRKDSSGKIHSIRDEWSHQHRLILPDCKYDSFSNPVRFKEWYQQLITLRSLEHIGFDECWSDTGSIDVSTDLLDF